MKFNDPFETTRREAGVLQCLETVSRSGVIGALALRRWPPASHVSPLHGWLQPDGIRESPPRSPAARASGSPVKGVDEAGHRRGHRQLPGGRVVRRSPGELGTGHGNPVDVAARSEGAVGPDQAVGASLRLDEARAAVQRADANLKLAESQNALARTTAKRTSPPEGWL